MKAIEVKNLTKSYGLKPAVSQLNFSVNKGDVVGFLGPNGAGKTTTMRMITGYMPPSSGSVRVLGEDIFENPISVKEKLGYLPENPPVYLDMKVKDYLYFVSELKKVPKEKKKDYIDFAIDKTDLSSVLDRLTGHLSKGYQQRVGIAQALVSKPEILILDEPTSGLDPHQVFTVRKLLNSLKKDHTLLISTHILSEVEMTCDRIIIINQGQIVTESPLEELSSKMQKGLKVLVKVKNLKTHLKSSLEKLNFVTKVESVGDSFVIQTADENSAVDQIAQTVLNEKAGLLEIKKESLNLEKIFIELTKDLKR